ncbi:DUF551 domain-containing protein [Rhizobium sp. CFBP 8762]|uniref:DUF551 domain-containing protein n=1 Tax=Rhizobium sp. CFBP 8762 TaxID=2775279 RepID=UPI0018D7F4EC|nr:DUF551 domain-containing protein [Rhizobium sp. CFBP 8762]
MSEIEHHGVVAMGQASFQERVGRWLDACFGPAIAADRQERNDRFIEEALELVQATGYSAGRAHALVEYVFNRPVGDPEQEAGGVQLTFASLCLANGLDMDTCGEAELARVWEKIDKIRAKQAAKPTGSALPIAVAQPAQKASCAETLLPESVTNEIVRSAMLNAWNEICDDTEHHPLDITQQGRRRLSFHPAHWADLTAMRIRDQLHYQLDIANAMANHKDARQLLADITADVTGQEWVNAVEGLFDKMAQRIAELEAERQWRLIKTAPRDKTHIFIAVPTKDQDGYLVGEAYFDPEPDNGAEDGEWWWAGTGRDNYFDSSINEGNWHLPTHWQPLPPAPLPASPHEGTQS